MFKIFHGSSFAVDRLVAKKGFFVYSVEYETFCMFVPTSICYANYCVILIRAVVIILTNEKLSMH